MSSGRDENGRFTKGNKISVGRPPKTKAWRDISNEMLSATELNLKVVLPTGERRKLIIKVEDGKTIRHAVIGSLITEALKGNIQAIRELADRTEGKPEQSIQSDLNDFQPIQLIQVESMLDEI